jgi:hypothetical protein
MLTKVTGETLTLMFSPQGALSSAKFESQNVTPSLRYVRSEDFEETLDVIGFKLLWPKIETEVFAKLNDKLEYFNLQIFNVVKIQENRYNVFLCSSKDPSFIHKQTLAVLNFNMRESKFVSVVRLFEINHKVCNDLLKERWSIDV